MDSNNRDLVSVQQALCQEYSAQYQPTLLDSLIGVARNMDNGQYPINGLRHTEDDGTSGWFVWSGEKLLQDDDFFQPMHAEHVIEDNPLIAKYLGLAPGWRFLIDPNTNYEDVWFDESLLGDS